MSKNSFDFNGFNDPICIYHHNCLDGLASAWCVDLYYKEHDNKVDFYPGIYNDNPPEVKDRNVLLVDFSYKRPVILEMAKQTRCIVIIDHHEPNIKELTDLPDNVYILFDINHSGCVLTWKSLFKDDTVPYLLEIIEDRDLWKFKILGTKEITTAIFGYGILTFSLEDAFDWLSDTYMSSFNTNHDFCNNDLNELYHSGRAMIIKQRSDIEAIISLGLRKQWIGGYYVPVVNANRIYGSEIGAILSKGQPFSASYYDDKTCRCYELRSQADTGIDVAEIAKKYGGGGHRNAAGFKVPFDHVLCINSEGDVVK